VCPSVHGAFDHTLTVYCSPAFERDFMTASRFHEMLMHEHEVSWLLHDEPLELPRDLTSPLCLMCRPVRTSLGGGCVNQGFTCLPPSPGGGGEGLRGRRGVMMVCCLQLGG
jgi:hypothetical protein